MAKSSTQEQSPKASNPLFASDRRTYGLEKQIPAKELGTLTQLEIEQTCFAAHWPIESGGLERVRHYWNILELTFPEYVPDPDDHWAIRMDTAMCNEQWITFAGAAGSAKTCRSALFAVVWWLASPLRSQVIFSSTTKASMRQRGWAEIRKFYSMLPQQSKGNMLDSRTMWQSVKGEDKHVILGIAVGDGPEEAAIDDIKGKHTQRQLLIIDEGTSVRDAIFSSFCNLFSYPDEFQVIVMGNPWSHLDAMGKFSEPEKGWASVGVGDLEWRTTTKLNGRSGVCLRFDAFDSPNVVHNRIVNRHLITKQKLDAVLTTLNAESPKFWSELRGMWPPDGLNRTIFTESLLSSMDAFGKFIWVDDKVTTMAALDPAFGGGDRAILTVGKLGHISRTKMSLQCTEQISLNIDAAKKQHVHYQLSDQVIAACKARGIRKQHFALDASGEGGGLAAIIQREWKDTGEIYWCEFGGAPSELPISEVDPRLCCDVYDRRVTELWYTAREFLASGQLKGFSMEAAFEFCNRLFTDEKKKISVETKTDMKARLSGRSPDHADPVTVLVDLARQNGLQLVTSTSVEQASEWNEQVKQADEVYAQAGEWD